MKKAPKNSMMYNYAFRDGYAGIHNNSFKAVLKITKYSAMVEVSLNNRVDRKIYNVHSHNAADASIMPNEDVLMQQAMRVTVVQYNGKSNIN